MFSLKKKNIPRSAVSNTKPNPYLVNESCFKGKDIVFDDDVIKEVAKRLNISKEKVSEIYKFTFNKMISKEVRTEDTFILRLGGIGRIYFRAGLVSKVLKQIPNEKIESNSHLLLLSKKVKESVSELNRFVKEKVPFKLFKLEVRQLRGKEDYYPFFKGWTSKEIEDFQNNSITD